MDLTKLSLNHREVQKTYWTEHSNEATVEAMMLDSQAATIDKEERPEVSCALDLSCVIAGTLATKRASGHHYKLASPEAGQCCVGAVTSELVYIAYSAALSSWKPLAFCALVTWTSIVLLFGHACRLTGARDHKQQTIAAYSKSAFWYS